MRCPFALLLALPLLATGQTEFKEVIQEKVIQEKVIQELDGTKLPSVPGPSTTRMTDPARGFGFSGLEAKTRFPPAIPKPATPIRPLR